MSAAPFAESQLGAGKLLLPSEVARELRRAEKTLAQWRSLGRGPRFVKIEGRIAYRAADLDAYLRGEVLHG